MLLSVSPTDTNPLAAHATIDPIVVRPSTNPDDGSTPVGNGFNPTQILTGYGINQLSETGAGQTIAIVDAYDDPGFVDSTAANFSTSDLAQFDAAFGLANPPSFEKVNQTGGTSGLPGTDPQEKWELEESLDVEWAHAIAPQANIVLVEANSSSFYDLLDAVQTAAAMPGVSVVSMSFGGGEFSGEQDYDSDFQTPNGHQGVTFIASAGDSGPADNFPDESPNVLSVGGTSLTLNANNTYSSESAWGTSFGDGTGGGPSHYETEPSYQLVAQGSGVREAPDVAFDADPNTGVALYDSFSEPFYGGPWLQIGGTSLSAPSWAGLIALTDQARVAAGKTTLDGATQTLPALYALPGTDFHDVTSGTSSSGHGVLSAGVGYDETTGLGTPIANLLVPDLAGITQTGATTSLGLSASSTPTTYGQPVTLTATVSASSTPNEGSVEFRLGTVNLGTVSIVGGVATLALTSLPAGSGQLSAAYKDPSGSFISSYTTGATVSVAPVPLTITAPSLAVSYGSAISTVTFTYSGFVNGDTAASMKSPPTPSYPPTSNPAVFQITPTGAVDSNYTISYVSGTLTYTNPPAPSLSSTSLVEGPASGSGAIQLEEPFSLAAWTAIANASWLHLSAGSASGTGGAVIDFTFDANTGAVSRSGTITIAGLTLSVIQAPSSYIAGSSFATLVAG